MKNKKISKQEKIFTRISETEKKLSKKELLKAKRILKTLKKNL